MARSITTKVLLPTLIGCSLIGLASPAWAWGDEEINPGIGDDPAPGTVVYTDGYVETHTHNLARYAYGGRYVHGEADAGALDIHADFGPCTGTDHAVGMLPQWLTDLMVPEEYDRMRHSAGTRGFDSDAALSFTDWPTWATISHSQIHPDHIQELFEAGTQVIPTQGYLGTRQQNLKIFVMSAVNYRPLCSLLAASKGDIDPDTGQPFDCDDDTNLERQIELAWGMSHRDQAGNLNPSGFDWFQVVTSYSEAILAIDQGQLAVVLHLEASELMDSGLRDPELSFSDIDLKLGAYYDQGVRSFQPVHELDNQFAGTARFAGYSTLRLLAALADWRDAVGDAGVAAQLVIWGAAVTSGDPVTRTAALLLPPWRPYNSRYARDEDSDGHNNIGLTLDGQYAIRAAMCAGMLVDVAHMSERGFWQVNRAAHNAYSGGGAAAGNDDAYPIFHSHGRLGAVQLPGAGTEYNPSDSVLTAIMRTGGMLGLRTDNTEVVDTNPIVDNDCAGSSKTFAQSYWHGSQELGLRMGISSDMSGAVTQMRPRHRDDTSKWGVAHPFGGPVLPDAMAYPTWSCGQGHSTNDVARDAEQGLQLGTPMVGSDFDIIGFGRYDLMDDIFTDVENLGQTVEVIKNESAQSFLEMWYRAGEVNALYRNSVMDSFCQFDEADYNEDGVYSTGEGTRGWPLTEKEMEEYLEAEWAQAMEDLDLPYQLEPDFMLDMMFNLDWLLTNEQDEGQDYSWPIYPSIEDGIFDPCEQETCAMGQTDDPEFPPAWFVERVQNYEQMQDVPLEPWQVEYLANLDWNDDDDNG